MACRNLVSSGMVSLAVLRCGLRLEIDHSHCFLWAMPVECELVHTSRTFPSKVCTATSGDVARTRDQILRPRTHYYRTTATEFVVIAGTILAMLLVLVVWTLLD